MSVRKRIDKINYYLNIAETVSQRSTCLKRAYGAIIVNNDEVIASGYNGAPRGIKSCLDKGECLRANSDRGMDYSNCISCHAEQNAIISASRRDMIGSTLYLVGIEKETQSYVQNPAPCSLCKRMIINAGIEKVVVRKSATTIEIIDVKSWEDREIVGGY